MYEEGVRWDGCLEVEGFQHCFVGEMVLEAASRERWVVAEGVGG